MEIRGRRKKKRKKDEKKNGVGGRRREMMSPLPSIPASAPIFIVYGGLDPPLNPLPVYEIIS